MPSISMRTRSPRFRYFGGSKPIPTPPRGPGGDDIPGREHDAGGDRLDQLRDAEDQVTGAGVLPQLVVDQRERHHVLAVGAQPADMAPSAPPIGGDAQPVSSWRRAGGRAGPAHPPFFFVPIRSESNTPKND